MQYRIKELVATGPTALQKECIDIRTVCFDKGVGTVDSSIICTGRATFAENDNTKNNKMFVHTLRH